MIQTVFSSLSIPLTVVAKDDMRSIFTKVTLLDEKGSVLDANKQKDNIANKKSGLKVNYEWSLANIEVKENDSYSFELPAELVVENEQKGSVMTEQNIEVGTFYVGKDRKGKITFTKQAEDESKANGVLVISAKFNEQVIGDKALVPLSFMTVSGKQVINVPFLVEGEKQVPINNEVTPPKKETGGPTVITNSILSKVVMKDKNGNIIDAKVNPGLNPTLGSDVRLEYEWALDNNHGYKAGSTLTFKLPDIFKVYSEVPSTDLKFGDITVGKFTVKRDGTVTVTFNEEIERRSDINGKITLNTAFQEQFEGSIEQEIIFPIKDGKVEKIPVRFKPKDGPAIDKKGLPNKRYNATELTWTVDFNKAYSKINEAVFQDPIEEGQALQANSIKVYKLRVNFDGTVSQGEEINPSEYTISKISGKDFQLQFRSPIDSAYRVVYKTDITNEDQKQFKNTATLTGKDFNDLSASTTVTVGRGTPLEKKSARYDETEQTIDWEIKYNYNEKLIGKVDAFLEDTFNSSQSLVDGSLKIYKIKIDENGNEAGKELVPANKYTLVPIAEGANEGFKIQFLEDINAAYKIEYKTKADERIFDKETIINKIKTHNNNVGGSQDIGQSILTKYNTGANYKDKTTSWLIAFNRDKHEMKDVKLTDVFPNKGLTLKPDTLRIVRADGYELKRDKDYVLDETNFTIIFKGTITQEHRITYTTIFDYEAREDKTIKNLTNKAILNWIDKNNKPTEKTDHATFVPDEYTQNNGYKQGSYNAKTKEITWNIGINYNLQTIKDAVLEDYILSDQQLIEGSLKVYEMSISGGNNSGSKGEKELKIDEDYTVERIQDANGNPGFRLRFKKDVITPYTVTYKTSLDGRHIQKEYKNTATLTSSNDKKITLDASVSVKHGGEYVSKSGQQQEGERIIDWQLNINFGQSKVQNAKVVDTPSTNQLLLEETFHLYETTVDENGNVTQGKELTRGQDYELVFRTGATGSPMFELSFKQTLDKPHVLKYSSYFNGQSGQAADNQASFVGDQVTTGTVNSNNSIVVKVTTGSGTGSGRTGSLEIVKVANDPKDQLLEGAEFTLYDRTGKYALKKGITDKDGKITFTNLIYDDYVLKEEKAPEGYVVGIQNQQKVTINQDKIELKVVNKKIVQHVVLQKYDRYNYQVKLEGVKFNLLDKDGKVIQADLETDRDGKIFIPDLAPGTYKFKEVAPLQDYKTNPREYVFTIEEKQTEIDIVNVANELIPGAVELTKVDKYDNNIALSDAVFNIVNDKGITVRWGLTTNAEGKILVKDLQPGNYVFIETKAPKNYTLDKTPITFTIVRSQTDMVEVTAQNELTSGTVELTKVDKDNKNIKLPGAEFDLYNNDGLLIQKGLKTNEHGIISVSNLKPGTYKFIETLAPKDYELNKGPIIFTVGFGGEKVFVTAENNLQPGKVELTKVDNEQNDVTLSGAEFKLINEAGVVIKEKVTTNAEGKILVTDLKPGKYTFIETKAPVDYVLDDTPIEFIIIRNQIATLPLMVTNKLIPGSVELIKIDKDNKEIALPGAEFELRNSAGVVVETGLKTNEQGKIIVPNLKPGKYIFVEIKAPIDYKLDAKPYEFTIDRSQKETVIVKAENELMLGSVELTKVDKELKELLLEGAEFQLQDSNGNVIHEKLTTDKTGKIRVENLRPGVYKFIETKAPVGYKLDAKPYEFTIDRSQKEIAVVSAENEIIRGSVELTKVDKELKEMVLEGAEFQLQDSSGKVIHEKLTTDKAGKIRVENLRPGAYKFIETKAPADYVLDAKPYEFTIEQDQKEIAVVIAENGLIPGSVELTKVDKDNNEIALVGAEFELRNSNGDVIEKGLKTNEQGEIVVSNLRPGTYTFVEMKAPTDYKLDEKPYEFTIERSQKEIAIVKAENELIRGGVELTKIDKDNKEIKLSGTEFELRNSVGDVIEKGLVTNAEGKITVSNLKPGTYVFVETKAPVDYKLDAKPYEFTIERSQKEITIVIAENELIRGAVELIKVDKDNNKTTLAGAEFELRDSGNKVIEKGLVTNAEGKMVVSNLKPGTYIFVETKAPIGYTLRATPFTFTIERSPSEIKRVMVENQKTIHPVEKPNQPNIWNPGSWLPNTGTNMFNLMLVGIGLLIVGVGLMVWRRKK
jgi:LPXTG-motif cell wall-anchored protein